MTHNTVSAFRYLVALIAVFALLVGGASAKGPETKDGGVQLAKTTGTPTMTMLNINNVATFLRSDGQGNHSPADQSGGYFPKGTAAALYEDGFVWGGKLYLDAAHTSVPAQQIRVGGQTYNQGTRAGKVNGFGPSAVAVSPADARSRIYRIRRDYASMPESEIRTDAATLNNILESDVTAAQMASITAQYATDWTNWPVDLGAPYVERNGTAGYQPPPAFSESFKVDNLVSGKYDEPGIAGADPNSPADQVVWTVYNDLDRSATFGLYRSEPIGLEGQVTMWGYKRTDALGNLYFKKIKLINKGGVDVGGGTLGAFYVDSMYISQWSDPDLGDSGDDLCGSDTTLSLGFIYNGNAVDNEYKKYGFAPPAAGYDFLQGPLVAGEAGDKGIFDLQVVEGKKNLPMTGFIYFSAGSPISDPALASTYESTLMWYRMLRGLRPDLSSVPERSYPFPPGIAPGPYVLTGDPVTGKGFVDGLGTDYSFPPGDRRIILASGPFTMAPGDTQDVVVGTVFGLGSDRLSSVSVMKFNDEFVQNTYNALFAVPKPPPQPDVKIAELDGKIVFEWSSNEQRLKDIEEVVGQPGDYHFEGYNVYQLPSASSTLSDAKRVATFDLPSDPAVVLDRQFDQNTGLILQVPIQFGSNSGVKRTFVLDKDYIRDISRLSNGTEYFVAVTAYAYSTSGFSPTALESTPLIHRVVAHGTNPGTRFASAYGDTIKGVTQTAAAGGSLSEGAVYPIVVDPSKVNGHTYKVTFKEDADGNTLWDLTDVTANRVVLANKSNQSGDDDYTVVDGLLVKVTGPATPGMKDWSIPSGTRRWTWAGVGSGGNWGSEGFSGAIGNAYDQFFSGSTVTYGQLRNVLLKLAATDVNGVVTDPNDPDYSFGYRYLRGATAPPAKPEFEPFIVNKTAGYAFQDYKKSVPLAAYNVETTPPTRLMVGYQENNSAGGTVDGIYWPSDYNVTDNIAASGPREWLYIFNVPYSETPDPSLQVDVLNTTTPMMWFCTFLRRGVVAYAANDEFLILANHINTEANTFTFSAPKNTVGDQALAKEDVGRVGVFPNPYYAYNPLELSRSSRFVTFNKLPTQATLRIFNLAGQLVRTLRKDDASQFLRWDLANEDNFPVASGMYIVHVDMPAVGATKILKLAIIQEQEVPNNF
ncbi:MAG: hypothetical protein H6Q31_363 [Bacteroidetes bacterium]|nr:hypothetical protein [Bacteroidota bacterium]